MPLSTGNRKKYALFDAYDDCHKSIRYLLDVSTKMIVTKPLTNTEQLLLTYGPLEPLPVPNSREPPPLASPTPTYPVAFFLFFSLELTYREKSSLEQADAMKGCDSSCVAEALAAGLTTRQLARKC